MRAQRAGAVAVTVWLAVAGCTGADQAGPATSETTAQRAGTTARSATTRIPATYPPVSGPGMVGAASTVPPNDVELRIRELNDAPTLIDLPCKLEHQIDGFTEQLSRFTEKPPEPNNIKVGTPLTYHGKPLNLDVEGVISAGKLEEDWIVYTTGGTDFILASIDPETVQVKGDTYRLTGCGLQNISRSPSGETWISVCLVEGTAFGYGTAVRLDPAGVSFNQISGLHAVCPRVLATRDYTWLSGRGVNDTPQTKRLRLWRIDPETGDWLTVDFPDTIGRASSIVASDDVLWQRSVPSSYCITQDPPESHGPTGVTFENLDITGSGAHGGVRDGQMWIAAEHHRLVAFDCQGNKIADYALDDPASVAVGEPGIIAQRPSRRDNPQLVAAGANITFSSIDPATGRSTDLLTVPAPTHDRSRGGTPDLVGVPFGITFDHTGAWLDSDSPVRIPQSWFHAA